MARREIRILDRTFVIEWGHVAQQADGAVLIRENETTLLVTAVAASESKPGIDFFPLTVEYRERFSAVGGFPGGYRKREGQASTQEILTSRLIDRSIRPLFPDGFRCETQVIATVLSFDPDSDPAVMGIIGASAALQLSDIPWAGPVAAIRVGRSKEGASLANPAADERTDSLLDLIATVGAGGLVMAEGGASELAESEIIESLTFAQDKLQPLLETLVEMREEGKPKRAFEPPSHDEDLVQAVANEAGESILTATSTAKKSARRDVLSSARATMLDTLTPRFKERESELNAAFDDLVHTRFRSAILETGKRADGRSSTDVRLISSEVGWLPRVHGSAIFTRGETQSLAVCTLGTGRDEQEVEGLTGVTREAFQLYYRFPPYSVGETRPIRGPGRREIGHGALALRALEPILPSRELFPYTVKLESEITASNGSSSMASVCGGCLAMMDAGVPLQRPVAGIAMGLIKEGDKTAILSDILGDEDHLGDMDFKVAGSENGVTALQLDNKIGALPFELLASAVEQARKGRLHILGEMSKSIAKPRSQLSVHAPRIKMLKIGVNRIRSLIGPGGRIIQAVQEDTSTKIDVDDTGTVRIYSPNSHALDEALKRVHDLTGEPEVGKVYRGTVAAVKDFGVFVRLFEGIEGLVHVTELADGRVNHPSDVASPGDEMVVVVLGVDGQGKIKLSRKQAANVSETEIETV